VRKYKAVKCYRLQKNAVKPTKQRPFEIVIGKKCLVARPKCWRTSSNSCQSNEALDLRALALGRSAVQATKFSTFPQYPKPEIFFCSP